MKKTYILYCCIISVILMPFKWFAPENMTDSGGNWISGNKKDCQAIKASRDRSGKRRSVIRYCILL